MPLTRIEQLFTEPSYRYKKGQIIMYAEDELTHVYLLKSGYVKMYSINSDGTEKILLIFPKHHAFPIFPGITSNPNYKLQYFYQAMTDIEIAKITLADFASLLEGDKQASALVLDYVTELSGLLVRRLGIIENKDAKGKISDLFHYLIAISGKEISPHKFRIDLKVTHQDIADLSGLTRETVSIQVKALEEEGAIIQNHRRRLLVYENLLAS